MKFKAKEKRIRYQ